MIAPQCRACAVALLAAQLRLSAKLLCVLLLLALLSLHACARQQDCKVILTVQLQLH